MTTATERPARRRWGGGARFFVLTWALLATAGVLWSLGTPLFSAADENSHVVKAVAVAHGQWTGEDREQPPGSYHNFLTYVTVPAYVEQSGAVPQCFRRDPDATADCAPAFDAASTEPTEVPTSAGRYAPLPYLVLGWPSLVSDGEAMVYLMRASGAVVCGALAAAGLTSLRGVGRRGTAVSGGLLAVTPMALAYAGSVNPSGLEIAAAVGFTGCLVPVAMAAPVDPRSRLLGAAACAAVLLNLRPSSPLFVLVVASAALALAGRQTITELLRERATWVLVGVGALASATALTWTLAVRPLEALGGVAEPAYASTTVALRDSLFRTERYYREMVGVSGWLDTPVPFATLAAWSALSALVVGLALLVARRRTAAVVVVGVLVLVLLPSVLQVPGAERVGLIFQGRYLLPLLALPLVVAATGVATARTPSDVDRAGRLVVVGVVLAQLVAFYWAMRRYAMGTSGELFTTTPAWQPPGGFLTLTVLASVLAGAALVGGLRLTRPVRDRGTASPGR